MYCFRQRLYYTFFTKMSTTLYNFVDFSSIFLTEGEDCLSNVKKHASKQDFKASYFLTSAINFLLVHLILGRSASMTQQNERKALHPGPSVHVSFRS